MHSLASALMSVQHHLVTLFYPTSSECVLEIEVNSWFKIILRFVGFCWRKWHQLKFCCLPCITFDDLSPFSCRALISVLARAWQE